ncbi:N-substituted formamide deformylase precursor [Gimesia chilikensis]|uniref:N-substituted formamide deformylase n=1 Tax=Gimesia chilikensis TaxID=2605989 RepID=A0A517WIN3_9PLAN|nr:amidohydrolase [Gimesia chilikensis]QDU05108.1 N-substituted formamide deformylase precursor [Gimesia chilikensis]
MSVLFRNCFRPTCLVLFVCLFTSMVSAETATLIFKNGKVITLDSKSKIAEAIAIRDGKILAVGSNAEMKPFQGEQTKVVSLDGKTVIPGLIESHVHALRAARGELIQPHQELNSVAEIQAWIRDKVKEVPAGRWITVPRTDITRLKERRRPTPAELDAACSTHPVYMNIARKNVLNTRGFELIGIRTEGDKLAGAKVIFDEAGKPLMMEGGGGAISKLIPRETVPPEATREALKKLHAIYNSVGITSILERGSRVDEYREYELLKEQNELTVRMTMTIREQLRSAEAVREFTKKLGLITGDGDDWVRVGPLKISVDGGIHWGSTRLSEPYGEKRIKFYVLEDPNYRGDLAYSRELMAEIFEEGQKLGWQMCCHATGDGSVNEILSALEEVNQRLPVKGRRFCITHAYFPSDESVKRSSNLGVCYDTQTYLFYRDADAINQIYGPSWVNRFMGLKMFVDAGVPVAINSDHMNGFDPDHSMNAFNPFLALYIAVSRRDIYGDVYGPQQKLSREEALRCMTSDAAYISFEEDKKGTLEPGKLADLVVLDRDYLTCPEEEIKQIKPLLTVLDGKVVYDAAQDSGT